VSGHRWSGRVRTWILAAAALTVPMGLMTAAPSASAEQPPAGNDPAAQTSTTPPQVARGVIVRTIGLGGVAGARAMVDAMPLGLDVSRTKALSTTTDVLLFDQVVSASAAQGIATALEARPDVLWAEPDLRVQIAATPDIPNDPLFSRMSDMWAGGGASDYSIKAPLAWGAQKGAPDVVVAVIDTGIALHPDLNANVVAGYDFISDVAVANDGNGWDPDPADPGDWITSAEASAGEFEGCEVTNSSWHGTHVSGTVAAVQDNNLGITGVAPGAKVQAVRALGKCGGYTSDIVVSITWASGGSVPGVPANATPAKVINMSLGGDGLCTNAYSSAINGAIARGTTVVVAAGNEGEPITNKVPANCSGVIAVTATDSRGQRANYSNYGVLPGQATLAAPGGDFSVDNGVLSTYNAGTRGPIYPELPGQYIYEELQGTSMATPHVAGAAALLYSAGLTTPASVRTALISSVQPFNVRGNDWDCTTLQCGAGILDAGRLPLAQSATVPGAPTGLTAVATSATTASLSWSAPANDGGSPITGYVVEESIDGSAYAERDRPSATPTEVDFAGLTPGATYRYRIAAINAEGTGAFSAPSDPLTMPTTDVTAPGQVSGFTTGRFTKIGTQYRVTVRWQSPADDGGAPVTGYVARIGTGSRWSSWAELSNAATRLTELRRDTNYRLQVKAVNSAGVGALAVYRFTTPVR
jgi:serine protease